MYDPEPGSSPAPETPNPWPAPMRSSAKLPTCARRSTRPVIVCYSSSPNSTTKRPGTHRA